MTRKINAFLKFFLLLFFFPLIVMAQNYADKSFYLVDSLNYNSIIESEKKLLDSSLIKYHSAKSNLKKLEAIDSIVENSWDKNIWPKYNEWMLQFIKNHITELPNDFSRKNFTEQEIQFFKYYAKGINNRGYFFTETGDIKRALKYYYESLSIREQLNDSLGLSESYNNLGAIYATQKNYEKALTYINKALKLLRGLEDENAIATTLANRGITLERLGKKAEGLISLEEGLALTRKLGNNAGLIVILNSLGAFHLENKDFKKSLEYFNESSQLAEKTGFRSGYIYSLIKLSEIHFLEGEFLKAKDEAIKAHQIALNLNAPENLIITSSMLSKIYQKEGNWKDAFAMNVKHYEMRDSIQNSEIEQNIIEQKAAYDLNKKQKEIELLSVKNEMQELKLAKNKNSIIFISIALLLAIIAALTSFRSYKKKQYINKLLQRQKNEISRQNDAKKMMLQEIHHRVKNNLQVVNSLLRMQSSKMEDENVVHMFRETQNRVRSMAKLHEKMYQSGDLENLNTKEHITLLIEEIVKNYTIGTKIKLDVFIDELKIDAQTMMPLSLIINEMITNSLKYAFENRKKGTIIVKLNQKDQLNELQVGDDGIGFLANKVKKGLGSKLIESFTKQINGNLEKTINKGTLYRITFPRI
ncbi:tetratricopeptide repeat-containing sensor histidine kinase [Pseudofulvibacter geojedonensis]|uniref:histidine kinase n=1 Tax=Pseudofulvibacter geojedonensis TaxID=1123758 RepID=A0ABW3I043_9FLAO